MLGSLRRLEVPKTVAKAYCCVSSALLASTTFHLILSSERNSALPQHRPGSSLASPQWEDGQQVVIPEQVRCRRLVGDLRNPGAGLGQYREPEIAILRRNRVEALFGFCYGTTEIVHEGTILMRRDYRAFPEADAVPLPSVNETNRSLAPAGNCSTRPLGQDTSIRSNEAAFPIPKCRRKSLLDR